MGQRQWPLDVMAARPLHILRPHGLGQHLTTITLYNTGTKETKRTKETYQIVPSVPFLLLLQHSFNNGDIFFDDVVIVRTIHADVDDIAWFDIAQRIVEAHGRVKTARAENLIGDAGLLDSLDEFHRFRRIFQLEPFAAKF